MTMEHIAHYWHVLELVRSVYRVIAFCAQWFERTMESLTEAILTPFFGVQKALLVGGFVVVLSLELGAILLLSRRRALS